MISNLYCGECAPLTSIHPSIQCCSQIPSRRKSLSEVPTSLPLLVGSGNTPAAHPAAHPAVHLWLHISGCTYPAAHLRLRIWLHIRLHISGCTSPAAHLRLHIRLRISGCASPAAHPNKAARRLPGDRKGGSNVGAKIANGGSSWYRCQYWRQYWCQYCAFRIGADIAADITQNSVGSGNTFERAFSATVPFTDASSDEEKRGESEEGEGGVEFHLGAELSKIFQRITNSKAPLSFFLERQPLETSPPFPHFSSFLLSVVAVHTSRHAPTHPTRPTRTDTHRHAPTHTTHPIPHADMPDTPDTSDTTRLTHTTHPIPHVYTPDTT